MPMFVGTERAGFNRLSGPTLNTPAASESPAKMANWAAGPTSSCSSTTRTMIARGVKQPPERSWGALWPDSFANQSGDDGLGTGYKGSKSSRRLCLTRGVNAASQMTGRPSPSRILSSRAETGGLEMTDTTVVDLVVAVSSGIAASCAIVLAWVGYRNLPPIRRRLTDSQYIVGELHELLLQLAKSPQESVSAQRGIAEPVLLADVRHARHDPVFDRIVFDFVRLIPGYTITPMTKAELIEREMQGSWGLRVILEDCRINYQVGPSSGTTAPSRNSGRPRYPALTEHKLVSKTSKQVEWVISAPKEALYLAFELSGPPRLVIDFIRQA